MCCPICGPGRNGGHLTPAAFSGFDARTTKYGIDEARRSYALEAHTASTLLRLIRTCGWTNDVDLVDGGHVDLLFTDQHVGQIKRDCEAAVRAGWSLDGVVDLSQEEVEAVSTCVWSHSLAEALIRHSVRITQQSRSQGIISGRSNL